MNRNDTRKCLQKIARKNDRQAFETLYNAYFKRLFVFCLPMIRSKESAEEIVNDVFIRLWERREALLEIENAEVYLYVAARNRTLDYIRKAPSSKTEDLHTIGGDRISFSLDPEQLMITKEMKRKIEMAIDRLPPRCKLIFKLIKEDGLKYKEVAAILDLSIKTVEAQLTIAMKKLTSAILISSDHKVKQKGDINN